MRSDPLALTAATAAPRLPAGTSAPPARPQPAAGLPSPFSTELQRHVLLGMVRDALESGQPDAALAMLDQLWSVELTREDCWYLRGQTLYELRRYVEAGQVAGHGLAILPRSAALHFLLCKCELRLHDFAGAERAIQEALALLPEHPVLLCRYADLLRQMGRADEAMALVARAELVAPGHPLVIHERGEGSATPGGPVRYEGVSLGLALLAGQALLPHAPVEGAGRVALGWGGVLGVGLAALAAGFAAGRHWGPASVAGGAALALLVPLSRRR